MGSNLPADEMKAHRLDPAYAYAAAFFRGPQTVAEWKAAAEKIADEYNFAPSPTDSTEVPDVG